MYLDQANADKNTTLTSRVTTVTVINTAITVISGRLQSIMRDINVQSVSLCTRRARRREFLL